VVVVLLMPMVLRIVPSTTGNMQPSLGWTSLEKSLVVGTVKHSLLEVLQVPWLYTGHQRVAVAWSNGRLHTVL